MDVYWLYVSANHFTGTIPTELANLDLDSFEVWENMLSGSIPSEFGRCTLMYSLIVDANQLTGTIPTELGLLSYLGQTGYAENMLSGTIPTEFGRLSKAKILMFHGNNLSGTIPKEIGLLEHLWLFNVSDIPLLTGTVPEPLCSLDLLVFDCTDDLCGCDCACLDDSNYTNPQENHTGWNRPELP